MDLTGRQGRRRKHLLDGLKEKRRCRKLNEKALDLFMCRTRSGRGYGPIVIDYGWMDGWIDGWVKMNE